MTLPHSTFVSHSSTLPLCRYSKLRLLSSPFASLPLHFNKNVKRLESSYLPPPSAAAAAASSYFPIDVEYLRREFSGHGATFEDIATNNDDGHEEVVDNVDGHGNDVREEPEVEDVVDAKEDECQLVGDTLTLRSSLTKVDSNSTEAEKKEKKKVQWVDLMGVKELAEIREFESSDENCGCVIL